jgi:hypothetical protein
LWIVSTRRSLQRHPRCASTTAHSSVALRIANQILLDQDAETADLSPITFTLVFEALERNSFREASLEN